MSRMTRRNVLQSGVLIAAIAVMFKPTSASASLLFATAENSQVSILKPASAGIEELFLFPKRMKAAASISRSTASSVFAGVPQRGIYWLQRQRLCSVYL